MPDTSAIHPNWFRLESRDGMILPLPHRRGPAGTDAAPLVDHLSADADFCWVEHPERFQAGEWVRIDREGMGITSIYGSRLELERGTRGNLRVDHLAGALVSSFKEHD